MKALLPYLPIAGLLLQALTVLLIAWVDTRAAAKIAPVKADLDTVKGQLSALESRMREAENDIDGLPTKADLARVEGEVKATLVEARSANAGVERIEGYFLKRGVDAG